jgi:hypothetical protein
VKILNQSQNFTDKGCIFVARGVEDLNRVVIGNRKNVILLTAQLDIEQMGR